MTENSDDPQHRESVESQIRHSFSSPLSATSRSWLEVGDIMTEDVTTVCPGSSVVSVAKIMSDKTYPASLFQTTEICQELLQRRTC